MGDFGWGAGYGEDYWFWWDAGAGADDCGDHVEVGREGDGAVA